MTAAETDGINKMRTNGAAAGMDGEGKKMSADGNNDARFSGTGGKGEGARARIK